MSRSPPEGPPRLICRCLGVSSLRIASAVRGGAHTLEEIQEQLRALVDGQCRRHTPTEKEVLDEG